MEVRGMDVWDSVGGGRMHLTFPNDPFIVISEFEFQSRVFSGEIIDPLTGSIIQPLRFVDFFPRARTMHVRYLHSSQNVTSIKKAIRAVMPSNFITETHWVSLTGTLVSLNGPSVSFGWSSVVTDSIESTYAQIVALAGPENLDYGQDRWLLLDSFTVIIRRLL